MISALAISCMSFLTSVDPWTFEAGLYEGNTQPHDLVKAMTRGYCSDKQLGLQKYLDTNNCSSVDFDKAICYVQSNMGYFKVVYWDDYITVKFHNLQEQK